MGLLACACAFDSSGQPTSGSGLASNTGETTTVAVDTSTAGPPSVESSSTGDRESGDELPTQTTSESTSVGVTEPPTTTGSGTSESGADESSSGGLAAVCGNGIIEDGESCETGDLGGFVCSSLGGDYGGDATCGGCQLDSGPCCVNDGVVCVPFANDCCNGCGVDFVCG